MKSNELCDTQEMRISAFLCLENEDKVFSKGLLQDKIFFGWHTRGNVSAKVITT